MNELNNEDIKYHAEFAYAKGNNIYLRYLTEEDARGKWHLWFNSPKVTKYLAERYWVNTVQDQLNYLDKLYQNKNRLTLAVVDLKTDKHIGICGLGSIHYIHRRAEISCLIGDLEYQFGTHAFEALALMMEVGFARLNLHKIYATAIEDSERSLALNKLLGFKESARLKEHCFIDGIYRDLIWFEIFQKNWFKSKKRPKIF